MSFCCSCDKEEKKYELRFYDHDRNMTNNKNIRKDKLSHDNYTQNKKMVYYYQNNLPKVNANNYHVQKPRYVLRETYLENTNNNYNKNNNIRNLNYKRQYESIKNKDQKYYKGYGHSDINNFLKDNKNKYNINQSITPTLFYQNAQKPVRLNYNSNINNFTNNINNDKTQGNNIPSLNGNNQNNNNNYSNNPLIKDGYNRTNSNNNSNINTCSNSNNSWNNYPKINSNNNSKINLNSNQGISSSKKSGNEHLKKKDSKTRGLSYDNKKLKTNNIYNYNNLYNNNDSKNNVKNINKKNNNNNNNKYEIDCNPIKEEKDKRNKFERDYNPNEKENKAKTKHVSVDKYKQEEKINKQNQKYEMEQVNRVITPMISSFVKPKGLYNLGLSCYMNSLLQCLYYIPELRNFFIEKKNTFSYDKPVCKAFAEVMYGLKYDQKEYYEPTEFKKIMGSKNGLFLGVKAGDAKDLFFNLIDSLLNEITNENDNMSPEETINLTNKNDVFREAEKEVDKNNIINKLFIGYYEAVYFCEKNKEDEVYSFSSESFILFNLENISKYFPNDPLTIDNCLEYNFSRRYKSSFFCSKCNKIDNNMCEERIYRPPEYLVLILNRGKGKSFKGKVTFGLNLNIDDLIDDADYKKKFSSNYKLISVSTHSGTSSASGHYTACCLTDNEKYYYFSDTYVTQVSESRIYDNEPYLLFYKRL